MKHPLSTIGLLSAVFLATAAPVLAAPDGNDRPPPISGPQHDGLFDQQGPEHFGPFGKMPEDGRSGPQGSANPGLDLAAKLSAAETYVGVTSAQEDVWRAYTSALIAFFDHPMPPPPGGAPGVLPDPDGDPQQSGPAANADKAPLVSERIAARAIDQGEKAKTLKAAVDALRSALAPDQLKRIAVAEKALQPPPRGPHGPAEGREEWHAGHGPRGHAGQPPIPDDMPPPPRE